MDELIENLKDLKTEFTGSMVLDTRNNTIEEVIVHIRKHLSGKVILDADNQPVDGNTYVLADGKLRSFPAYPRGVIALLAQLKRQNEILRKGLGAVIMQAEYLNDIWDMQRSAVESLAEADKAGGE